MPTASLAEDVARIREFNRFYTNQIGVLREGLLGSRYSLTEARVLYELGRSERLETKALRESLDADRGYLSRILTRFERAGLVRRARSELDGRRQTLELTGPGRSLLEDLDRRAGEEIGAGLESVEESDRARLLAAMGTIREVLGPGARPARFELREPRAGDLGWVVARHGAVYAASYGWDESFEALVARIVADFAADRGEGPERAWIAEAGGAPVGCVFCTRRDEETAQLRLLLVERRARGLGIGRALVEACVGFAREAGYRRLVLWTDEVLAGARRIYEGAGFRLVAEERHRSFGADLNGQDWELEL
jgi:DNA-binding MarR family transcriptional regulator/N-acetylglutamate synthase-like GNAT family acetyltransferase